MRKVRVDEAVGMILAHDITEIIPGKKKDVAFRKGQRIEKNDVKKLLDLGKTYVYVFDGKEEGIHEDEAAVRIAKAMINEHMDYDPPKEGRVSIRSKIDGLFYVDKRMLLRINLVEGVLFTTLPNRHPVKRNDVIAATRIVPLYIDEKSLKQVERMGKKGVMRIQPFVKAKVGLVVTGSEIFLGRVEDGSPVVEEKIKKMGCEILEKRVVPDNVALIKGSIVELFDKGAEIVVTTGGLSVDPDDVTKEAIEASGAKILFYGTPIFPGAMFLLASYGERYILGAPACIYYNKNTAFDIIFARILAGERFEKLDKKDIASLSYGGLCYNCESCHYPICYFGKGM
ncbi:MAG: molybdopterin-binding protein [Desulfobacterota bacterium]|nr:molybdopterin-binding protein [Thermodesulfobacteriota bacterium]MDW8002282.1 molybdopterin-binding protein [Deltaproteobacteria bacterium]